jgi:hypothetical protein
MEKAYDSEPDLHPRIKKFTKQKENEAKYLPINVLQSNSN